MKRNLTIIVLSLIVLFTGCNHNRDKKEAARKFLREQTAGYEKNVTPTSITDFDKKVHDITDKNLGEFIGKGTVIVDFWATWCVPCRKQAPVIEELATELGDKVRFGKMDIDKNQQTANDMEILNIPTMMVFKDGKVKETLVGLQTKEALKAAILKHL